MLLLRASIVWWLVLAALPAWACSPPLQREVSGFARHAVGTLPKNARGVMFFLASGTTPRGSDFTLTSDRDPRPLALTVRAVSRAGFRIEPVQGFAPGVRYTFRYLPAHGAWHHPDAMQVLIDDRIVAIDGPFALVLAPRPKHRMIVVPGGTACVQPVTAVVQEFTYTVPPALRPYAASLAYSAGVVALPVEAMGARLWMWPSGPQVYSALMAWTPGSARYDSRTDAVVAPCGKRSSLVRLRAFVGFPEVDGQVHALPQQTIDLARHVDGACNPLDALVATLDGRPFEPTLRDLCGRQMMGKFAWGEQTLRAVPVEEWAFQLGFFYDMSPTCNLVGLAHVLHDGRFSADPAVLDKLGDALKLGLGFAKAEEWDAAVHALHYLVTQLPPASQAATARRLLAPARPVLVAALAGNHPQRRAELARLIAWGGEPAHLPASVGAGAK